MVEIGVPPLHSKWIKKTVSVSVVDTEEIGAETVAVVAQVVAGISVVTTVEDDVVASDTLESETVSVVVRSVDSVVSTVVAVVVANNPKNWSHPLRKNRQNPKNTNKVQTFFIAWYPP